MKRLLFLPIYVILSCSPMEEMLPEFEDPLPREEADIRMLALGDSYTIGESVATDERWPHQLAEGLRGRGYTVAEPDYIATTGWTTGDLLLGIATRLDTSKNYNFVSVLIGVNNQYQGLVLDLYEPELRTIIDKALEIVDQDSSRVIIVSIPDYAYTSFGAGNESISQEIDVYNGIKASVAAEYGISFFNITPISRKGLQNTSLVASDGLHPSGEQYGLWVEKILPYLDFE